MVEFSTSEAIKIRQKATVCQTFVTVEFTRLEQLDTFILVSISAEFLKFHLPSNAQLYYF